MSSVQLSGRSVDSATPHVAIREPQLASQYQRGLVEIAIPVLNEQAILNDSVRTLHRYLVENCPYDFLITIADNASTDRTWEIATALSGEIPEVRALHLDEKGKGRAVRAVWQSSRAEVVAYMDVDLSTDLSAFNPLVAPLFSSHSGVAIGTRLSSQATVERGAKRELISRCYNTMLKVLMAASFSDAQCGFKAARADVVQPLLDKVHDEGWFFDAELLLLAEASSIPIFEVPVRWTDDPDTRVNVVGTARADLTGMVKVAGRAVRGDFEVADERQSPRGLMWQLIVFSIVGLVSTVIYTSIYMGLRDHLNPLICNMVAVTITAVINTMANRRFTFGIRGPGHRLRQQLEAGVAFLFTLLVSTSLLTAQQEFFPDGTEWVEVGVVLSGGIIATVFRFILLREWVFNPKRLIPRAKRV